MGGYFGAVSHGPAALDVFFGVDYHSHLGTKSAGMVTWDRELGFKRDIHSITNTPFRTKFEKELHELTGTAGIGCISDTDPQPILVRSHLGVYAIIITGIIRNAEQLAEGYLKEHDSQLTVLSSGKVNTTELVAALINESPTIVEGIVNVREKIKGSLTVLILTSDGEIIAARDKLGRIPVQVGKREDGRCVSFESFAYEKLGYTPEHELGPGEIVKITADGCKTLLPPGDKMKVCAFLWSYYGYSTSVYEGVNVETMRYRNGEILARNDEHLRNLPEVDYAAGVPDSGIAHAIGYAAESGIPYARPLIKYTPTWPRSFMPEDQNVRNRVARMKQIPVNDLIRGKKLLFIDDSIVRGTQLSETVDFLYESGAEEVHVRSACPPIMYACPFLNFSRSNADSALLARKMIHELEGEEGDKHIEEYADAGTERGQCLLHAICEKMRFDSLGYQSLDGLLEAIGLDRDKVCTYCWTGKE